MKVCLGAHLNSTPRDKPMSDEWRGDDSTNGPALALGAESLMQTRLGIDINDAAPVTAGMQMTYQHPESETCCCICHGLDLPWKERILSASSLEMCAACSDWSTELQPGFVSAESTKGARIMDVLWAMELTRPSTVSSKSFSAVLANNRHVTDDVREFVCRILSYIVENQVTMYRTSNRTNYIFNKFLEDTGYAPKYGSILYLGGALLISR